MGRKTLNFQRRLEGRLLELDRYSAAGAELDTLLAVSRSAGRFDSPRELRGHLTEGALLNVNALASRAIGIPSGEYVVWTTPARNTILVPAQAVHSGDLLATEAPRQFELSTRRLLGAWNKLERTIAEEEPFGGAKGNRGKGFRERDVPTHNKFASDPGKIDRPELKQAIERSGKSQAEVADAVGVGEPTVSRWLQDGEKSTGRDPTLDHLVALSNTLGTSMDSLGLDPESHKPRRKTRGSGRGGAGKYGRKGSKHYRKGGGAPS